MNKQTVATLVEISQDGGYVGVGWEGTLMHVVFFIVTSCLYWLIIEVNCLTCIPNLSAKVIKCQSQTSKRSYNHVNSG